MTGKQEAVMWLGLTLIVVRLFTTSQWHDIWATILKGASKGGGGFDIVPPPGPLLPDVPALPELPALPLNNPSTPSAPTNGGSMSI